MSFLKFLRSLKIVDYKTGSFYTTKNFRENYFAKTGIDLTEQRIGQLLRKNGVRYFMFNVDYPKKRRLRGYCFEISDSSFADEKCSCKTCHYEDHICPFLYDVEGDIKTLCNCCPFCENNCYKDI